MHKIIRVLWYSLFLKITELCLSSQKILDWIHYIWGSQLPFHPRSASCSQWELHQIWLSTQRTISLSLKWYEVAFAFCFALIYSENLSCPLQTWRIECNFEIVSISFSFLVVFRTSFECCCRYNSCFCFKMPNHGKQCLFCDLGSISERNQATLSLV